MLKQPRSLSIRYLLPAIAIGTALLIQFGLQKIIPQAVDFPYPFLYLIAIFAVAWVGGYTPGVIACLFTMVGIPCLAGFRLRSIDPTRLVLLIGVSLLISAVANAQRRKREVLSDAKEELDKRVQVRTHELAHTVQALEAEVEQRKQSEQRLHTQLGRLNLLDQITRAIGERQDLRSVFQVTIRSVEDDMPVDFACACLYEQSAGLLNVTCIGVRSEALLGALAVNEQARIDVEQNHLTRCVRGQMVYEPDVSTVDSNFARRLASAGLGAMAAAPLLVESHVFGILIAARQRSHSFSSGDCEFLRQLGEHVALASHQAEVYAALKQAYEDLRQTQQTVMQTERLRALGQMASGIAHDINNAISPVALYTEILLEREPNLSSRARSYLETTQRAIDDVAHTVARLREFYRQHEPQSSFAQMDLNELIQQVRDLTHARWSDIPQQRGVVIQLQTDLLSDLPQIAGIESEIREALTNLVFNAVDAMPEGGTLTLRTKVSLDASGLQHISVEVSDTGVGMDEATLRCCLEPFFTTKGERGTGLGLAMVYGIARRHNAEVELESVLGQGTTARLKFPAPTLKASAHVEPVVEVTPQRLRILVVDDDPLLIKSLRDTLEVDGHAVTTASDGQSGIDTFRAVAAEHQEPFAAVITDLGMPHIDGRKVATAVKAVSPSTPVILLTGWGQRLVAEGDVPPNVDRVLNKPPRLSELRTALAELVTNPTDRKAA